MTRFNLVTMGGLRCSPCTDHPKDRPWRAVSERDAYRHRGDGHRLMRTLYLGGPLSALAHDIQVPVRVPVHAADWQCEVDQTTLCCAACGVDHGGECSWCGGRGFHLERCPVMQPCPPGCPNTEFTSCPLCFFATGNGCIHGVPCEACRVWAGQQDELFMVKVVARG